MKKPSGMLGKYDLNKGEICEVVMQTVELASTREATDRMIKVLNVTYAKEDLNQIADNKTLVNTE